MEALAQGKVKQQQLHSPFLSEVLSLLNDRTLISLLKDLYHSIEPGPDWAAIDGYHEAGEELKSRGYAISVERVGPEDWAVIVSPNGRIPY